MKTNNSKSTTLQTFLYIFLSRFTTEFPCSLGIHILYAYEKYVGCFEYRNEGNILFFCCLKWNGIFVKQFQLGEVEKYSFLVSFFAIFGQ